MRGNNLFKLIIAIGVSLAAGVIGSAFTLSAIPTWYAGLVKPAINPPAWLFGPVWTTLYVMMGISAWLVWNKWDKGVHAKKSKVKTALAIFGLQLVLNASWSIIFFGLQSPGWALVTIVLLWLTIVWTMVVFCKISRLSAYLLVPYLLWVSFACYLNYTIWVLN